MLHFVEVQDVNLTNTGIAPVDEYTFLCGKWNCDYHIEAIFVGLRGRK
jgi:hypothetical protein